MLRTPATECLLQHIPSQLPMLRERSPSSPMATSSTPRWLGAAVALAVALPAQAGRPMSVDDAGVADTGQGQLEAWWEGARGARGTSYLAPAYSPWQGMELGAVLARDHGARTTLHGLQAKWLWSPSRDEGCNAASSVGVVHTRHTAHSTLALTLVGTCATPWGALHANLGALRMPERHWAPAWGFAVERAFGPVTVHAEAFGQRGSAPTFQTGARWEWAPQWQLDGSIGRQQGRTLLSAGIRRGF
jgi:hypothetical protein